MPLNLTVLFDISNIHASVWPNIDLSISFMIRVHYDDASIRYFVTSKSSRDYIIFVPFTSWNVLSFVMKVHRKIKWVEAWTNQSQIRSFLSLETGSYSNHGGRGFYLVFLLSQLKMVPCLKRDCEQTSFTVFCRSRMRPFRDNSVMAKLRDKHKVWRLVDTTNKSQLFSLFKATSFWSDGAYWCEGTVDSKLHKCQVAATNYYNIRSRGYFVPRQTGDYRFMIKADDTCKLYMAINGTEENKVWL